MVTINRDKINDNRRMKYFLPENLKNMLFIIVHSRRILKDSLFVSYFFSCNDAMIYFVIPAEAGIHNNMYDTNFWIPACAGMTIQEINKYPLRHGGAARN
jgi:hypothetical protein